MSTQGYFYIVGINYKANDNENTDQFSIDLNELVAYSLGRSGGSDANFHNCYQLFDKLYQLAGKSTDSWDEIEITSGIAEEILFLVAKGESIVDGFFTDSLVLICRQIMKAYREGFRVFFRKG